MLKLFVPIDPVQSYDDVRYSYCNDPFRSVLNTIKHPELFEMLSVTFDSFLSIDTIKHLEMI